MYRKAAALCSVQSHRTLLQVFLTIVHILLLLTQIEAYIKVLFFFPHEAIEHRSLIVTVAFARASTLTLPLREMLFTYIHTPVLYNDIA